VYWVDQERFLLMAAGIELQGAGVKAGKPAPIFQLGGVGGGIHLRLRATAGGFWCCSQTAPAREFCRWWWSRTGRRGWGDKKPRAAANHGGSNWVLAIIRKRIFLNFGRAVAVAVTPHQPVERVDPKA
jgi:hypothetical protein